MRCGRTSPSDAAVANCVSELRAALGDDSRQPRYIEVAHRRGYRWIAPVEAESSLPAADPAAGGPVSSAPDGLVPVGRERELQQLEAAFARALSGQRQIVFVTGEPGLGKTTLVDGALAALAAQPAAPLVACGQCVEQHGASEPYLPVLDALTELCRQPAGAAVLATLRQQAPMWLAQMPSFLDAQERTAVRAEIHGASRERMLREMGDALGALAAQTPLVLVLEDVHWSDAATIDLIGYLARRRAPARLLVIATYRPVTVSISGHPLKAVKRDCRARGLCDEIALTFLSEAAVATWLAQRFPRHAFPAELPAVLHRQTDGNPLFMTTVVDFLLAQGAIARDDRGWRLTVEPADLSTAVPDSLKQMIERQIDDLAGDGVPLLEAASLVGAEFSIQPLAAAAETAAEAAEAQCEALVGTHLLRHARGVSEWPDGSAGARYAFAHALYQKVLCDRIAPARRRRLHQRIGERIERAWMGRPDAPCAELATHFEAGGDQARMVQYLREAAARAMQRGGIGDARVAIDKALAVLDRRAPSPETVTDRLALTLALAAALQARRGYADPEVESVLRRALTLSEQVGAEPQRFAALLGLCASARFRGRHQECTALADELLAIDARLQLPGSARAARTLAGLSRHAMGKLGEARALLVRSLSDGPWPGGFARPDFNVTALLLLGSVDTLLGFPERGVAACRDGLEAAQRAGPYDTMVAHAMRATQAALVRDLPAARRATEDACGLAEQYGFEPFRRYTNALRAWALAMESRDAEGIAALREVAEERQRLELDGEQSWIHCLLASALLASGHPDQALEAADHGMACADRSGERWAVAELHRLRGECIRAQRGPAAEVERCLERAIEVARAQDAKWWELRAATSLVDCRSGSRRARDAVVRLRAVYDWFTEGLDTLDLREARARLA
jgi:tetratricopeptide (TPR) repeat protein